MGGVVPGWRGGGRSGPGKLRLSPYSQLLILYPGLAPQVTMCDRKAVIKNADMSEEMQQDSVECATQALEKYNIEKDIAAHIKKVRTGRGRGARAVCALLGRVTTSPR